MSDNEHGLSREEIISHCNAVLNDTTGIESDGRFARVSIEMPCETLDQLEQMAATRGITMRELLAEATGLLLGKG